MARNRRHSLRLIQQDSYDDASKIDGLPFTGKNVGVAIGNVLAQVNSLARVMESLLPDDENPEEIELTPVRSSDGGGTGG